MSIIEAIANLDEHTKVTIRKSRSINNAIEVNVETFARRVQETYSVEFLADIKAEQFLVNLINTKP